MFAAALGGAGSIRTRISILTINNIGCQMKIFHSFCQTVMQDKKCLADGDDVVGEENPWKRFMNF